MANAQFPKPVEAPADERCADMIDLLQEVLADAREGHFRSLAIVTLSPEGEAMGTRWSMSRGDVATTVGMLTVLIHDLMAARE